MYRFCQNRRSAFAASKPRGVGLASFFGHSGPTAWTFDPLLSAADATALVLDPVEH